MKTLSSKRFWVLVWVTILGAMMAVAQTKPAKPATETKGLDAQASEAASREELQRTIEKLDAEVFDAYNTCNLEKFGSFFPEQLEFYHDQGGLTDTTREQLVGDIKKYICGKVRRELVKGSLEVYPMRNYGAVELGRHRFTHPGIDDTMKARRNS
jgi:hypothetical protein